MVDDVRENKSLKLQIRLGNIRGERKANHQIDKNPDLKIEIINLTSPKLQGDMPLSPSIN